jgi:hypothetical protein
MGVNERARQLGRTRFSWQRADSRQRPTQADDEIERTALNDRSIATNHSADSPASPLRE